MEINKTNWDKFIVDKKSHTKEKQANYQKYLEDKYLFNKNDLKEPLRKEKEFFQKECLSVL